jgi:hypothetical protein
LGEEYDSWMEQWIDGFIKNGVLVYAWVRVWFRL